MVKGVGDRPEEFINQSTERRTPRVSKDSTQPEIAAGTCILNSNLKMRTLNKDWDKWIIAQMQSICIYGMYCDVCLSMCATVHTWRSEDNFVELPLSFHHIRGFSCWAIFRSAYFLSIWSLSLRAYSSKVWLKHLVLFYKDSSISYSGEGKKTLRHCYWCFCIIYTVLVCLSYNQLSEQACFTDMFGGECLTPAFSYVSCGRSLT